VIAAVKLKQATILFQGEKIIFECPLCGRTLMRSNFEKVSKLLEKAGAPRGKICPKCGGTVLIELDPRSRKRIESRIRPER
jgi:predicted RNA-binding Zn-ribbon protein involved in translation (DUF1610 family)